MNGQFYAVATKPYWKCPGYPLSRRLGRFHRWFGHDNEKKNSHPFRNRIRDAWLLFLFRFFTKKKCQGLPCDNCRVSDGRASRAKIWNEFSCYAVGGGELTFYALPYTDEFHVHQLGLLKTLLFTYSLLALRHFRFNSFEVSSPTF